MKSPQGPVVAIGTGRYGDPVLIPCADLKKAMWISGTSRSGKTRLANSCADQQTHQLGAGQIVLDFKGDDDLVMRKAETARRHGRSFYHFQLAPKSAGTGYEPPHPYCPPRRAHYDPFARGNGASKAAMLLNSVPRDGDAAAYVRRASEAVKLAWDIAALKGMDQPERGREPLSGLEVLARMLDADTLIKAGSSLTVGEVRAASNGVVGEADARQRIRRIQTRLQSMQSELSNSRGLLAQSIGDTASLISTFLNDSALDGNLTPGSAPGMRIDLVRAVLRREIIVFSLPTQDYPDTAAQVGTMVLLDMQNTVSTLRSKRSQVAEQMGLSAGAVDSTPWPPVVLQVEEAGSINSAAAAEAFIGLFNKSSDVGVRPILSSQSIGDLVDLDDGRGVLVRRLFAQMDHLLTLKLTSSEDAEAFARESEVVRKTFAVEEAAVTRNRFRFGQGAGETANIRKTSEDATRIPSEAVKSLRIDPDNDYRELLYINSARQHTAVHTVGPEGPNNWYEPIRMVPVLEKPYGWNPFTDPDTANAAQEMEDAMRDMLTDLRDNKVLRSVLSTRLVALDIDAQATVPELVESPRPAPVDQAVDEAALDALAQGTADVDDWDEPPLPPDPFDDSPDPFAAEHQ